MANGDEEIRRKGRVTQENRSGKGAKEGRYSRLSVVLLPLSLWPRRRILISCFIRLSLRSSLSISSMPSLTRFASSSAKSLRSRSAGDSFGGGCSAAQKGSDKDLRRFGTSGMLIVAAGDDSGEEGEEKHETRWVGQGKDTSSSLVRNKAAKHFRIGYLWTHVPTRQVQ